MSAATALPVKSASPGAGWPALQVPLRLGPALRPKLCASIAAAVLAGCAARPLITPAPGRTATHVGPASSAGMLQSERMPQSERAALLVASATAMLGQPYRWGGDAPGGFDCSGLVHYAARSAGIFVRRTAQEQLQSGIPVARGALQPGDLVFMHLAGKHLHVGIVIGGGRFIHAPATGGRVRIDSLDSRPYASGFLQARRVALGGAGS